MTLRTRPGDVTETAPRRSFPDPYDETLLRLDSALDDTCGRGLTDSVQLRWIRQTCALDTSGASACAHSAAPPSAATHVMRLGIRCEVRALNGRLLSRSFMGSTF